MKEYEFHEIANIFPLMEGKEFEDLKEDIDKNGLLEGIVLYDGKILDGRNRYKACKELDRGILFKKLPSTIEPLDYVIAENLNRRHLTSATKAEVGLSVLEYERKEAERRKLEQLKQFQTDPTLEGGTVEKNKKKESSKQPIIKEELRYENGEKRERVKEKEVKKTPKKKKGEAIQITAKKLGISHNTLRTAEKVKEMNDPTINKKWKQAKQGKSTIKSVQIAIKKKENKAKPTPKLPEDEYDVIYADPPWTYNFSETPTRALENQYPTMSLDDICKLKIPSAKDSILFLWCTSPKLYPEGMKVIKKWGFTYKTSMVWVKDKIGMGYYARSRHEYLLIATKGRPGTPEPSVRPDSVIEAPRCKHSKKPELYELIEKMYPSRKYLELFARKERKNWKSWGNEI